jgi:hypothetical protein
MATAISVLDSNQPDSEQASIIGSRVCVQGTILSRSQTISWTNV